MLGPLSQCATCARMRPWTDSGGPTATCEAFPGGIPDAVWTNTYDHRKEVAGDHGVRWESNGQPFPEWAMPEAVDSTDDEDEYAAA